MMNCVEQWCEVNGVRLDNQVCKNRVGVVVCAASVVLFVLWYISSGRGGRDCLAEPPAPIPQSALCPSPLGAFSDLEFSAPGREWSARGEGCFKGMQAVVFRNGSSGRCMPAVLFLV